MLLSCTNSYLISICLSSELVVVASSVRVCFQLESGMAIWVQAGVRVVVGGRRTKSKTGDGNK